MLAVRSEARNVINVATSSGVVNRPIAEARRILKRFPGIGDPGADRILLLSGAQPVLGMDSNALRVLVRLGYAREQKNYGKQYRAFTLEQNVDEEKVEATYSDGVLELSLPKKQASSTKHLTIR